MDRDELFDELFGEFPDARTKNLVDDPSNDFLFGDENGLGGNDAADDTRKILEAVEAVEAQTKKQRDKPIKGFRRPKLDQNTLVTPNGLPKLKAMFEKHKVDPNLGPYENMRRILTKTEYWAHNFHPSLNFDDFLEKVRPLGNKDVIKKLMSEFKAGVPRG